MSEITPGLVRELHEARFGAGDGRGASIAVLTRDASGEYRVESQVIAESNGRPIIAGQAMVVSWADGEEMTDSDYAQLAAEMSREAAERAGNHEHPVAILNTSIATEDGTYVLRTVTTSQARELIAGREILSAVGHGSTAQALTEVLGTSVPVNRIEFRQQPGQVALVFKLRGRPAEGVILDLAQVEAIGFDLKVLERLS